MNSNVYMREIEVGDRLKTSYYYWNVIEKKEEYCIIENESTGNQHKLSKMQFNQAGFKKVKK